MVKKGLSLPEAIEESYPLFTGVFSLLVMTKDSMPLFVMSAEFGLCRWECLKKDMYLLRKPVPLI